MVHLIHSYIIIKIIMTHKDHAPAYLSETISGAKQLSKSQPIYLSFSQKSWSKVILSIAISLEVYTMKALSVIAIRPCTWQ